MKDNFTNIEECIIAFLTNDITEQQQEKLNDWKLLDRKNQEEFDLFVSAWAKSENLSVFSQIDTEKDWNCVWGKIKQINAPKSTQKIFYLSARRVAAVLIPAIFISVIGLLYWNVPGLGRLTAYKTDNQTLEVQLPDGSIITLNKNSQIIFNNDIANASKRSLKLSGEALFKVFHNSTPFNVNVGDAKVSVLGTEFNIEENNSDVYVSVISGKVKVETDASEVKLTKGERAFVNNGKIKEETAITENDTYWCNKVLKFKQANLADICKELQKNFTEIKTVKFNSKDLNTKVTTTFKNQSLKEILEELEIHFSKKITFDGSILTVSD